MAKMKLISMPTIDTLSCVATWHAAQACNAYHHARRASNHDEINAALSSFGRHIWIADKIRSYLKLSEFSPKHKTRKKK